MPHGGIDRHHAKRETQRQQRLNDDLRIHAKCQFMAYTKNEDECILRRAFSDRRLAHIFKRSLYAIRARRKRLKNFDLWAKG